MTNRKEKVETVRDFILGGSKITADGDCSYEIKMLTPWKKSYDKPRHHIEKQRHHFTDKGPYSQSYGFSSSQVGCECWTIKKAEHQRIDAFKLWCWRRLLRVPWTARRSNQSILKEFNSEYSLEGLILKLQYFGHLMRRADSLEKMPTVKNLPANAGDIRVASLIPGSGRSPGERAWQPTPVFLPGESHGQRSLAGYSP